MSFFFFSATSTIQNSRNQQLSCLDCKSVCAACIATQRNREPSSSRVFNKRAHTAQRNVCCRLFVCCCCCFVVVNVPHGQHCWAPCLGACSGVVMRHVIVFAMTSASWLRSVTIFFHRLSSWVLLFENCRRSLCLRCAVLADERREVGRIASASRAAFYGLDTRSRHSAIACCSARLAC